jgi:hypothetical protein
MESMRYGLLRPEDEQDWHIQKIKIGIETLDGKTNHEKNEYLSKIFKLLNDPIVDDFTKYDVIAVLEKDCRRKIRGLQAVLSGYEEEKRFLLSKQIKAYKQQMKVEFAIKWSAEIASGRFTGEMMEEYQEIEMAEKHSCFIFNGLQVSRKSCRSCASNRKCFNQDAILGEVDNV